MRGARNASSHAGGNFLAITSSVWNRRRPPARARAASVELTETRIPEADALAGILQKDGFDRDHVRSTVRVVRDYAALLRNPTARTSRPATTGGKWWKGLFG